MKKALFLILTLFLVACSTATERTSTTGYAAGSSANAADSAKEFTVTARNWEFNPDTITVNKGDAVVIHLQSLDVAHGFALPDFDVNERVEGGQSIDVKFVATKAGTFSWHCSVFCGQGHKEMEGKLIVNE